MNRDSVIIGFSSTGMKKSSRNAWILWRKTADMDDMILLLYIVASDEYYLAMPEKDNSETENYMPEKERR